MAHANPVSALPGMAGRTKVNPWLAELAQALGIDAAKLAAFLSMMDAQGLPVDAGRFFMDPAYGYQRLAAAHSCANERLRRLALELFEGCQRLAARRAGLAARPVLH